MSDFVVWTNVSADAMFCSCALVECVCVASLHTRCDCADGYAVCHVISSLHIPLFSCVQFITFCLVLILLFTVAIVFSPWYIGGCGLLLFLAAFTLAHLLPYLKHQYNDIYRIVCAALAALVVALCIGIGYNDGSGFMVSGGGTVAPTGRLPDDIQRKLQAFTTCAAACSFTCLVSPRPSLCSVSPPFSACPCRSPSHTVTCS